MRRLIIVGVASLVALSALVTAAAAQDQQGRPLILRVQPRSFLDPGTAAPVGSLNNYATQGATSYLASPPWMGQKERFGEGVLPDPIGGPLIGARNPFPTLPPIEDTGSIR